MTAQILDFASAIFIGLGCFFVVVGAFGLLRMPDVFTRMHAASVMESLGAGFLILGMLLQTELGLVTIKLLIILAIIFFTGPVVTHALAQAAMQAGVDPLLHEDRSDRLDGQDDSAGRES